MAIKLVVGAHVDLGSFGLPSTVGLNGVINPSITKTRGVGIYLGLVATAGLAAGGYLTWREA